MKEEGGVGVVGVVGVEVVRVYTARIIVCAQQRIFLGFLSENDRKMLASVEFEPSTYRCIGTHRRVLLNRT